MSKYTTEIRFICESAIPLDKQGDGSDVETAIESGRNVLFNFPYDLFLDTYKEVIESKFLRHNYTREIGFETVGLFKLKLRDLWLMKLPYYNQLWESSLLEFDPFLDVDYQIKHEGKGKVERDDTTNTTNDGTLKQTDNTSSNATGKRDETTTQEMQGMGNSSESGTQTNSVTGSQTDHAQGTEDRLDNLLQKYSDTPQGGLDGIIDTDWLTNATQNINTYHKEYEDDKTSNTKQDGLTADNRNRVDTSNSKGSGTGSILTVDSNYANALKDVVTGNTGRIILDGETNTSDEYLRRVWGKYNSRSYSKALIEFRETFLNIDEMFIKEFKNLFMLIY